MLQNAYFLAKIGADTAENEEHFAEILPKTGNYPTGPHSAPRGTGAAPVSGGTSQFGKYDANLQACCRTAANTTRPFK